MFKDTYEIYKIRDRATGEAHERESRRQGHKIKIVALGTGYSMIYEYLEGGYLTTSTVENIEPNERELEVRTRNTIYTFKKSE